MSNDMEEVRSRFANQRTNQAAVSVRHEYREGQAVVNELDRSASELVSILRHLREAGLGAATAGLERPWEALHDSLVRAYGMLHRLDELGTQCDALRSEVSAARNVVDLYQGARWRLDIQDEPLAEIVLKLVNAANSHKRDAENVETIYGEQVQTFRTATEQVQWGRDYIESLEGQLDAAAGRKLGATGPARMKRKARAQADHLQALRATTVQSSDVEDED